MMFEMITKEIFVGAIDSIRKQMASDKLNSTVLGDMFPGSELASYDNSLLIRGIIDLLRLWFPKDENGFCELEHYCFDLDFGRGQENIETTEMFYDRLVGEVYLEEKLNEPNLYAKQDTVAVIRKISSNISHLI